MNTTINKIINIVKSTEEEFTDSLAFLCTMFLSFKLLDSREDTLIS